MHLNCVFLLLLVSFVDGDCLRSDLGTYLESFLENPNSYFRCRVGDRLMVAKFAATRAHVSLSFLKKTWSIGA